MFSGLARPLLLALVLPLAATPFSRAAEAPSGPPSIEELTSQPKVRQPRLSPDGTKIAFLFPHERKMALGVFDRATKESRMILRATDESIYRFYWKGNDRIVFEADVAGNESFFIGSTDLTGKNVLRIAESQRIENNLTGDFAGLIDPLPLDPERIAVYGIFAGNIDNATYVGTAAIVGRLNVRNRGLSPQLELRENDRAVSFVLDHRGTLRLRSRLEGRTLVWEHRTEDHLPFRRVAEHPFHGYAETWHPETFAADNTTLWLVSREEHDRGALYALDTRTFTRGPALFVPPEGEISEIITTPDRARLLGVRYEVERGRYHWFDADRAALQAKLEKTFPGCDVRLASRSDDQSVALVWVGHDREAGVYYVLDQKAGSLTQFKRTREIDPARLAPRRPIQYPARDGLTIHGYLTLPAGAAGHRVPLIIHPHGGPYSVRDEWGYDPEVQFLASRGYAVLQPNYRGSGGYGLDFLLAGRREWAGKMQDDLSDAVHCAIAQGFADPARVAIVGASYGGYAALAGVTFTPELYACAVNYVGVSDLGIIAGYGRGYGRGHSADRTYESQWIGDDPKYIHDHSPVNFVENIRVPTLHAYGENDPRVDIDNWRRLKAELDRCHKPYEYVREGDEGHGFRRENARISFYRHVEDFLARHLAAPGQVKIGPTKVIDLPARE
jgi:dipeptidyl aminopeptidase/acylaminoacyl peptidase